jgi:hypothetical protein
MDRSESQSLIDSMTTSVTIMPLPKISQWRYVGPCGRNQNSQAMQFVQEDSLDCPRPSIGKHNPSPTRSARACSNSRTMLKASSCPLSAALFLMA